eukprot:TRINITY_DN16187_c0_g1_i1.p1 TRINITY_DN16187_c0_g1~~TRINITY_DN16187_c0_g1_i1.p1  ORF type:complete len:164 (-),score=27.13 TRINITY_DN16187_c0_g1_i1:23-514(-)
MERESKVKGQSCGESDEQEKPQSTRGSRMVARTITTLTLADLFAFYALLAGWPLTCDASWYLKAWLIVGLLLSWPASGLVAWLGIMQSFRRAFMLELGLLTLAFAWLAAGSVWCWESEDCMDRAPVLFWPVFSITVFVWSAIITTLSCLVLTTVLTVMAPKQA